MTVSVCERQYKSPDAFVVMLSGDITFNQGQDWNSRKVGEMPRHDKQLVVDECERSSYQNENGRHIPKSEVDQVLRDT